jgi:hypothetical protein
MIDEDVLAGELRQRLGRELAGVQAPPELVTRAAAGGRRRRRRGSQLTAASLVLASAGIIAGGASLASALEAGPQRQLPAAGLQTPVVAGVQVTYLPAGYTLSGHPRTISLRLASGHARGAVVPVTVAVFAPPRGAGAHRIWVAVATSFPRTPVTVTGFLQPLARLLPGAGAGFPVRRWRGTGIPAAAPADQLLRAGDVGVVIGSRVSNRILAAVAGGLRA